MHWEQEKFRIKPCGLVKSSFVGTRPRPTSSQAGCATAISYTKLRSTKDKNKECRWPQWEQKKALWVVEEKGC
jgi:hypothetical protein